MCFAACKVMCIMVPVEDGKIRLVLVLVFGRHRPHEGRTGVRDLGPGFPPWLQVLDNVCGLLHKQKQEKDFT